MRYGIYNNTKNTDNPVPYIGLNLNQMSMKKSNTFTNEDEQFIGFKND